MAQHTSTLFFCLAAVAGLCTAPVHAADAPGRTAQDPCVGTAKPPAAASPRMTLNSVTGSPDRAVLNWEAVAGATEYRIFREPRCPAQARSLVGTVAGNVTTWGDTHPMPRAWYSVETAQSAGTGIGRRSNAVLFDASKAAAPTAAKPPAPPSIAPPPPSKAPPPPPSIAPPPPKAAIVAAPLLSKSLVVAPAPGTPAPAHAPPPPPPPPPAVPAAPPPAAKTVPGSLLLPVAPAASKSVASVTAPSPAIGPTDTLERRFALDGQAPHRDSFALGLTAPGTVQVSVQWKGNPLSVSLRPAKGSPIDSKNVSGGSAELKFAVNAAQVAQNQSWVIDVANSGTAEGQIRIVSPRPEAARMGAAKNGADAALKTRLTNADVQPNGAVLAKLTALQKTKADAATASLQRIRAKQQQLVAAHGTAPTRLLTGGAAPTAAARIVKLSSLGGKASGALRTQMIPVNGTLSDTPVASTTAPQAVFPGTTLTVDGRNFRADDEAWFILPSGEVKAQKTYVSTTRVLLQLPAFTQSASQDAYLYFKYLRNGQTLRTEDAYAFRLQPTTPTLAAIALSDPNDGGPIRPGKVVTLSGSGLAADDKLVFIVQNREYEAAHFDSAFNSDAQLMATVPRTVQGADPANAPATALAGAFAGNIQAQVYVKRASGALSSKLALTLAPELMQTVIDISRFSDEFQRDSRLPDRNAYWMRGTTMGGRHETASIWGAKDDDYLFQTTQLRNSWVVTAVEVTDKDCTSSTGYRNSWDAYIAESAVGTPSLRARVHWWIEPPGIFEFNPLCTFRIHYYGEGPLGMPYK